ncbi:Retrovirus-related Pol polyprotein from transposon RE1 [Sesamum angolense]|uniref:Retrovirus-related Pol polyprotein from transposon RE1 n=1 Tax=Sesamum angolense TaxID=2727404 RepID=A0AAE1WVA3_9LAMI|nr:Retrovirus-related Pol polyprotein from transposon RE1 [Sesamum angolense]
MGNSATAEVMEKGKVLLKLTSGKTLALLDVLYVPSLRRNLISGSLLNKVGLKIVLEADKVIITRNDDFIGKGPDIAYAVSRLSRNTHNPNIEHRDALPSLLKFLKVLLVVMYLPWVVERYFGNLPNKHVLLARSTMKSEFIALELVGQEAEWLRNLVGDIPLWGFTVPVSLHCDSQAAIGIANNYAYNSKRRHIRLRHSAVKELLKNGIISMDYVRFERNLADPLTKGLTRRIILETSRAMGLKSLE